MTILVKDILSPKQTHRSYMYFICDTNNCGEPLDAFAKGPGNIGKWMKMNPLDMNNIDRQFIFAMIDFYHDNNWLFLGNFEVIDYYNHDGSNTPYIAPLGFSEDTKFYGRLKISLKHSPRSNIERMENFYDSLEVMEILPSRYSGVLTQVRQ